MKNKKIIILVLLSFIVFTNCKNNKIEEISTVNNEIKSLEVENDNNSCEEILYKIVESSKLDLRGVKEYFVRIESIETDTISIQVYSKNNLSENDKQKQIVESTIAWLIFLPNSNKLLNITADPENPTNIIFTYKVNQKLFDECNIIKSIKKNSEKECIDLEIEMGSGEECLIKNTNIINEYQNIILNKEVEHVEYFYKDLPKVNTNKEIKKDGLNTIEYIVSKNEVDILMNYDGGLTEVKIQQINNNIKRTIIYNAD